MLRSAFSLAFRDARYLLRRRETLVWTFAMPIVFFYFIGTITGGFGGGERKEPIVLRVPADAGFLAGEIERRLSERGYEVVREEERKAGSERGKGGESQAGGEAERKDREKPARVLVVPPGFTADALAGR